jgi:hypothetical protein
MLKPPVPNIAIKRAPPNNGKFFHEVVELILNRSYLCVGPKLMTCKGHKNTEHRKRIAAAIYSDAMTKINKICGIGRCFDSMSIMLCGPWLILL